MKKQRAILYCISLAARLGFLSMFFFLVCLTGALTERVISLPVMLVGCGGMYLVGKWLYHLIPKIDKRIWQMEKIRSHKTVCSSDATASGAIENPRETINRGWLADYRTGKRMGMCGGAHWYPVNKIKPRQQGADM